MTKRKLGPVSPEERGQYLARLGSDGSRGCPLVEPTSLKVWDLLAKSLGIELDDVTPAAKQAFVVALDTVIEAGRHATGDLFHRIFDALASRWSTSFRDAGARGAFTVYNMTEQTVKDSELLIAGIPLDALWRHTVTKWLKKDGENPFYDVRRVPFGTYQIILSGDPTVRDGAEWEMRNRARARNQ